jgi:hypothetical protein
MNTRNEEHCCDKNYSLGIRKSKWHISSKILFFFVRKEKKYDKYNSGYYPITDTSKIDRKGSVFYQIPSNRLKCKPWEEEWKEKNSQKKEEEFPR